MGAYTEIVDFTFTANETSRSFTGLNITKDDFIKIVITQVNGSGSTSILKLFPNTAAGVSGFDTATNYHVQTLFAESSSPSAARANDNIISQAQGSTTGASFGYFKISENGKSNSFINRNNRIDSSLANGFSYTTSSNLTFNDPITSLTFTSSVTNGIGTGSRIQIYRLDAVKEADITTTANATQVDISSLSIGKDSEYLLVSDVEINKTSGDGVAYNLFINDNTTATNYYRQIILGNGTTTSATRTNDSVFQGLSVNKKGLSYSHIKLSEIGAYTHQSYQLRNYGTTDFNVVNNFVSSTAENITSITKLNIVATEANMIKSGSRFILYKLK